MPKTKGGITGAVLQLGPARWVDACHVSIIEVQVNLWE